MSLLVLGSFYYTLDPFYNDCQDLVPGMPKEEVDQRISKYMNRSDYTIGTVIPDDGKYGWNGNLTYDHSVRISGSKNSNDSRRCDLLFKNGLLVEVEPKF